MVGYPYLVLGYVLIVLFLNKNYSSPKGDKKMLLRVMPSDPDYEKLNHLSEMIAVANNPQVHFCGEMDMDNLMRVCLISDLEDAMEKEMNDESMHGFPRYCGYPE